MKLLALAFGFAALLDFRTGILANTRHCVTRLSYSKPHWGTSSWNFNPASGPEDRRELPAIRLEWSIGWQALFHRVIPGFMIHLGGLDAKLK